MVARQTDKKSPSSSSYLRAHHLPCYWTRGGGGHINFRVIPPASAATAEMRHHQGINGPEYLGKASLYFPRKKSGLVQNFYNGKRVKKSLDKADLSPPPFWTSPDFF